MQSRKQGKQDRKQQPHVVQAETALRRAAKVRGCRFDLGKRASAALAMCIPLRTFFSCITFTSSILILLQKGDYKLRIAHCASPIASSGPHRLAHLPNRAPAGDFAAGRGVGGLRGPVLRLRLRRAACQALSRPSQAARGRMPALLALSMRRPRPARAARPVPGVALPAGPPTVR